MKKLLFVLFLSFACTSIYAQVKATNPDLPVYNNGDSYGYYIDEIPGALYYTWTVVGPEGGSTVWYAGDRAIDVVFSKKGMYDIICTVTMADGPDLLFALSPYVQEE
ncbi:hypothetical protein [Pedobacter caeni]|uniref:PKD domain-containing protein n=1 Tax=Pedobacter caeni TaxID=288992 RepID=A0A1M4THV3_9SPHI|nr:hypothetical protein [Pedobacter caeni]SHE44082.1 hypothetical protein SAMN04488522_101202 [Pedobacter caeni]